ncbi:hypothetical protein OG985_48825 (plasmid) [Streptomyces sp. NBC_00289]|uniref:hypothetical protein n=1 Tax=Streptomyces sp. NBC_00289 TaxID=2975703 RepID=UPI002F91A50E
MEVEAIPHDRIRKRAQLIMQHQRRRDARYTVVLTWTSLTVTAVIGCIGLLLTTDVLHPEAGSVLLALTGAVPGAVTAWLRTLLRTTD